MKQRSIEPMLATAADSLPEDDTAWAYEVKWDGYRMIAFVEGGEVRLQTRGLLDVTADFPELGPLGDAVGPIDAIFDGEMVAFDTGGRPSFGAMQRRGDRSTPRRYVIFDVLEVDGRSTTSLSYLERRRLLDHFDLAKGAAWDISPMQVGGGAALVEATRAQGLEGVVAKRLDSTYEPGRRSRSWLKVKNWARQEFVVGGWLPGQGRRAGGIGSLLLGVHDGVGALCYAGRVGTGFNDRELDRLQALLQPLTADQSPFVRFAELPSDVRRNARWVQPDIVVEVAFAEWTHTGTIRQPSYRGLRTDKLPATVVREN